MTSRYHTRLNLFPNPDLKAVMGDLAHVDCAYERDRIKGLGLKEREAQIKSIREEVAKRRKDMRERRLLKPVPSSPWGSQ